jgi:hypothetical protein
LKLLALAFGCSLARIANGKFHQIMYNTNALKHHAAGFESNLQLSSSAKAACAASPLSFHHTTKHAPPPLFCSWQGENQGYCSTVYVL